MDLKACATLYRNNLLQDVIPFWLNHSPDKKYGGYFTCLDREGKVYDTDKFLWLQCRQVWTFAMLYNRVEKQQVWLDTALLGAEFLARHGRSREGRWYFSLTREGQPLVQPYNIFSDCFAAMAFGQLFRATGDTAYRDIAVTTFDQILSRQDNPKGPYSKSVPGTRPLKNFALPMILTNLVLELEPILDPELVTHIIRRGVHTVMEEFYQPDQGLLLENIGPGGAPSDSFEGRLVNPGHGLEAMWFMMDIGSHTGNRALIDKAVKIALQLADYGWDDTDEGIFYFLDAKGHAPQQLEWDQKLWWVHAEGLVCMLKGYLHTGNEDCLHWFEKIHRYLWDHFVDEKHGEWFGYLNRQGEVLLPVKGGKWKGCFHTPRALFQGWKTLEAILETPSAQRPGNGAA
ncbi:AGE family epimerase/isomerase [Compostibacter hankyongensis]